MSTQKRRDEDFSREIRAHIDIETARLIEEGLAPGQARAAARRAFGNVTRRRALEINPAVLLRSTQSLIPDRSPRIRDPASLDPQS